MTGGTNRGGREIAREIAALRALPRSALLARWRGLVGTDPPKRATQDLLIRGLVYTMQEQSFGSLTRSERQALKALASGKEDPRPKSLEAGTRLYREWRGKSHEVLITDEGCRWRGRDYQSLSEVARAITGTRWSGPRFFGLAR